MYSLYIPSFYSYGFDNFLWSKFPIMYLSQLFIKILFKKKPHFFYLDRKELFKNENLNIKKYYSPLFQFSNLSLFWLLIYLSLKYLQPGDMKVVNPLFSDSESRHSDKVSHDGSPSPPIDALSPNNNNWNSIFLFMFLVVYKNTGGLDIQCVRKKMEYTE